MPPKKKRGKKGKKKNAQATPDVPTPEDSTVVVKANKRDTQQKLLETMYGFGGKGEKTKSADDYKFWSTQPVPRLDEEVSDVGQIDVDKTLDDIQAEPLELAGDAYTWADVDLNDSAQLDELYNLLRKHYVTDDDGMFRFNYSREFLLWALQPPGWLPQWHAGMRVKATGKLVAFISAIPADMSVKQNAMRMVEINFLCAHKKLRSKRLAPILIKEITRRVNREGIWQAAYTAGVVLPKPVAKNRYWHRSLNVGKLIDIGFSRQKKTITRNSQIKLYRLPKQTLTPGIRPLLEKDCDEACTLLMAYLQQFDIHPVITPTDFRHWFLEVPGVVNAWVVEDPNTGRLTDMISFYHLPSTIIKHKDYNVLRAAYSYYNVSTKTPWEQLMKDALILAKQLDFDVFNALDVMENSEFLKPLKFGIGDGHLQYYLYNYRCPEMEPSKVGLVLM